VAPDRGRHPSIQVSGFVLSVRRDGHPPDEDEARRMADAAAARGAAGRRLARTPSALALYLIGGEEPGVVESSPLIAADGSVLLLADARIDNRRDLAEALDRRDLAAGDDAALLLCGYLRWQEAVVDRLIGDFAFIVWDERRRALFAARGPSALRPLFFHASPRRLLLASEVSQILAADDLPAALNEGRIASALAGVTCPGDWTFYRDVQRLPQAHTLRIEDAGGPSIAARPIAIPAAMFRGTFDDAATALREALSDAVRDRVAAARAPGLLLSGGLDSLAIAGTAGLLRSTSDLPELATFSFAGAAGDGDETRISGALAAHYGFPNVAVPASDAWPLAEHPAHGPARDAPDRLPSHVLFDRSLEAARDRGVRVLMSGQRGDAVIGGFATDYVGRLLRSGPGGLWRDLAATSRATGSSHLALINRYLVGRAVSAIWPGARALRRRMIGRVKTSRGGLPVWIHPSAVERFDLVEMAFQSAARPSRRDDARRRRYEALTSPRLLYAAEALERQFARMGIRHVDPWADARLARLVLQLPEHIVTPPGRPKGLLRQAMEGVLPENVRQAAAKRLPQAHFDRGVFDRASAVVLSLIEGSRAAERGFVDPGRLRAAYDGAGSGSRRFATREWSLFWRFLDVEDWLRRYHD
jgi:asparagine synthase (glutamine-hydrolysing)